MVAFAAMMAWFLVQASRHPEPLVTEDYYGAELRFQGRIDQEERAGKLSRPVRMDVQRSGVQLEFPPEMAGERISGTLRLQRPNDPRWDRTVTVATDSLRFRVDSLGLLPGRWNVALEWASGGITYFIAGKAVVP